MDIFFPNYLFGSISCIFLYIIFLFIACCCFCYEKGPQRNLLYESQNLDFYILALESTKIETANQNPRWIHQIRLESKWATWILCDILPAFHHSFHSLRGHFGHPRSNLLPVRIICLDWCSVAVLENRWAFWMTRNGLFLIINNELEWFKSQLGSKT